MYLVKLNKNNDSYIIISITILRFNICTKAKLLASTAILAAHQSKNKYKLLAAYYIVFLNKFT